MFKICVYVPAAELERVKNAMFDAGAGRIGNYDRCCWQVLGRGQFRPLENSEPAIGQHHQVETVEEYRLEMICDDDRLQAVIVELLDAHPYEEPAYQYWQVNS